MTTLNDAIAQAAEAAQSAETPETQNTPVVQTKSNAPAVVQPSTAMTMDNAQAGMAVDGFLKMGDGCVEFDKVKYPSVKVEMIVLDVNEGGSFQIFEGLNYEIIKGQFKYSKTYDRATVAEGDHIGKSWQQHIADIQAQAPSARPFQGYNLFMIVAEDTDPVKKGEKVLAKGTVLGFSTTPTSSKTALAIWQRVVRENRKGDTVLVDVTGEEVENGSKQKYKKMVMSFLGYVDQVE